MIKAALTEIKNAPIATLGALAGIASFAFVLFEPVAVSAVEPPTPSASAIALALTKAALTIPAVAFFCAFVSHFFFTRGFMRGVFASALFLLVSLALGSVVCGLVLSPFHPVEYLGRVEVLGVQSEAFALATGVLNVLVYAVVLSETLYAYYQQRKPEEEDPHADALMVPLMIGLLMVAVTLIFVSTTILNVVLAPS